MMKMKMKPPLAKQSARRLAPSARSPLAALVTLAALTSAEVALAQAAPSPDAAPHPEAAPAPDAAPAPAPEAAPAAAPVIAPAPTPTPAPAPPPAASTTSSSSSSSSSSERDDYYSRQRGVGIFHHSRLVLGALAGSVPDLEMDPAAGLVDKDVTMYSLAFEGVYLGLPSSYGNFHGIELAAGVRTSPWDFWASFGTAISFLNVGRGGPGSFRLGGSFGAGFNLAHGYGYVRGRVAFVVLPARLDAEVSTSWTPTSASTQHYEEIISRASLWYRPSRRSDRAYEAFVESFSRQDDSLRDEREVSGLGAGFGMTLF